MRDDALYTGITSASYARTKQERERRSEAEKQKVTGVSKDVQYAIDKINKEIDSVPKRIFDLVGIESTEETYKSCLIALKLYDGHLHSLKADLEQLLPKVSRK